jgi:hypothetical protein
MMVDRGRRGFANVPEPIDRLNHFTLPRFEVCVAACCTRRPFVHMAVAVGGPDIADVSTTQYQGNCIRTRLKIIDSSPSRLQPEKIRIARSRSAVTENELRLSQFQERASRRKTVFGQASSGQEETAEVLEDSHRCN